MSDSNELQKASRSIKIMSSLKTGSVAKLENVTATKLEEILPLLKEEGLYKKGMTVFLKNTESELKSKDSSLPMEDLKIYITKSKSKAGAWNHELCAKADIVAGVKEVRKVSKGKYKEDVNSTFGSLGGKYEILLVALELWVEEHPSHKKYFKNTLKVTKKPAKKATARKGSSAPKKKTFTKKPAPSKEITISYTNKGISGMEREFNDSKNKFL